MNNTAGSYTTCSGFFYDSGGASGNYSLNESSTLTFYPSTANSKLTFNFYSFASELFGDFLTAYDGPSIASPQIGIYNDSDGPVNNNITATNPQGAITFRFTSNAFTNMAGWSAAINCIPDGSAFYNMNYLSAPKIDTVCSGFFFDAGGLSYHYANSLTGIHTFYPSTPNAAVQMDFSYFNTENNYDGLMIYNGPDTTYPLLSSNLPVGLNPTTCPVGSYRGVNGPNLIKSTDISGALTFVFNSNAGNVKPGWLAAISCVPNTGNFVFMDDGVNTHTLCGDGFYDSGSVLANYSNNENYTQTFIPGTVGDNIKLDFGNVNLGSGDTLFIYDGLNSSGVIKATFTGTQSSINVISSHPTGALTAKFKSDGAGTAAGWHAGISCIPIYIPYLNMVNVTSPYYTCFGDFYDSGGPTQPYGSTLYQTLTLYPSTANYALQANFLSFETEDGYDGLRIFDGPTISSPLISSGLTTGYNSFYCPAGAWTGTLSPGLVTSSHPTGALTFVFGADANSSYAGWHATLNCVAPNTFTNVNFTSNVTQVTTGGSVNFTDLSTNNPTAWLWSFPGATITSSTAQNPTNIIYNTPGCYTVSLTATNAAGTNSHTETCFITVVPPSFPPVAAFTANTTSILAGGTVNFTDLSTNFPTSRQWTFTGGTPSSSNVQNPSNVIYNTQGCYTVKLIATNAYGSDTLIQTCYITVSAAPVAAFTASANLVLANGSINFTDQSSNTPTSWLWTFPGGNPSTSTQQNPSNIIYGTPGCYDVTLVSTNAYGNDTETQTCYITVADPLNSCTELFISEYVEGSANDKVLEFYNPSSNPINLNGYSVHLFTNGASSPSSTYNFSGIIAPYDVFVLSHPNASAAILSIADATSMICTFNGNDAVGLRKNGVLIDAVGVVGTNPGNEWIVGSGSTVDNTLVRKANVDGPSTSWTAVQTQWTVYPQGVISYLGSNTNNCAGTAIPPLANFTSNTQNITTGQSVNFTDLSTNNPTTWTWTFTGGSPASSTSQNPTNIVYNTPGCYQVSLTVTNSAGSNTFTQTCYITVSNTAIPPLANFTSNTQNITTGQSVNFTDLSTNNPTSWNWTFTGGSPASSTSQNPTNIVYNTPGCYQVSLTATNSAGSNTSTQTCYINVTNPVIVPVANFTASSVNITTGQSVNFTDLSTNNPTSWNWVFTGAAPASSTSQNPSNITYNTAGCYQVSLTATNSAGSNTSTQTCYITVTNPIITPVANFTANTQYITVGQSVNFTDFSTNNPTSWNWVFTGAAPASSTSQNPSNITYNTAGCYEVSLTATNSAGSNTSTQTCYINVVPAGIQPQASFNINPNPACTNSNVNLLNASTNALSFNWDMPGATPATSTAQFPVISYATSGTYQIKLIAINGANSDTLIQTITVNPTPIMNTSADESICFGSSTTLNASASGSVTYNWTPSATLSTPTLSQTLATPNTTTDYVVTINDGVCSASDTITVTVWPLPSNPTITQVGNTLEATSGFPAYQWHENNVIIAGETQSTITPLNNGNYTVEVIDSNGCISTSQAFAFVIQGIKTSLNNEISIYPNPLTTILHIDFKNLNIDTQIEIKNLQGQIILNQKVDTKLNIVNLDQYSNGVYFIKINSNNEIYNYKLVKQ
jgi:PKD repeat protein